MAKRIKTYHAGEVIFRAYELGRGCWVGSRQAPGEPEEFLRSYPTPECVEKICKSERPQQRALLVSASATPWFHE